MAQDEVERAFAEQEHSRPADNGHTNTSILLQK
jgi:hypothetical protein